MLLGLGAFQIYVVLADVGTNTTTTITALDNITKYERKTFVCSSVGVSLFSNVLAFIV
jgi:hypothetical protein